MPWRPNPFAEGGDYRVRRDFTSIRFQFTKGSIVRFISEGYSRYDSATIYSFEDSNGANLQWWLSDDEDASKWKEFFEPC